MANKQKECEINADKKRPPKRKASQDKVIISVQPVDQDFLTSDEESESCTVS